MLFGGLLGGRFVAALGLLAGGHAEALVAALDGDAEFLAAAFGAKGGYGAQVRYRLRRGPDGERRLGRWYWGAIVGPGGERVLEQFNP